jgi:monoamine oxidase
VHSRKGGIPVWWSLTDDPLITGWVGGPSAQMLAERSKAAIRKVTLDSLSEVLAVSRDSLVRAVRDIAFHNWSRDPFSRGAYSFTVAGHDDESQRLREPVQDTLFFAGEATADGEEVGTVHGALASGIRAANEVALVLGA